MAEVRYKGRIALLAVMILLVFSGISVRLFFVHLKPSPDLIGPLEKTRRLMKRTVGSRGRIIDRNGEILAMDLAAYHVCADPSFISQYGDVDLVCSVLNSEFGIPIEELREQLAMTERQYVRLKKYVPGYRLSKFKHYSQGIMFSPDEFAEGSTNKVYLCGVLLEEAPIRNYPKGSLMAHVVGFANQEGVGSAGIEQRMDDYLRGKEGLRVSEKDARSREIYSRRTVDVEPEDGADVMLTLDQQLQYVVEKSIARVREEFKAQAVLAIVQHVRTGEILAMASSPTYDLNRFNTARPDWRRNRALSYIYEPGSTMKAATVAIALDRGVVKEDDTVDCEKGYWVYGGKSLRDSHSEGILSVADVVKVSSNIGTAKIALQMGDQMLYDGLRAFGFGSRLGLPVPGEEAGIFYSPKTWSKISSTRIGMGHEIGVTAMQILSMLNTIANDGRQMRPLLIKQVTAPDGEVLEEYKPEVMARPISVESARRMKVMLSRVTEEGGTGTKAAMKDYTVAGKTGTAQKIRPKEEGGGYYEKNFYSSFVGFLPAENPEIGIIVVADDPGTFNERGRKENYYGGTVCGPAFKEIAEFAVRYLRIPPEGIRIEYTARLEL